MYVAENENELINGNLPPVDSECRGQLHGGEVDKMIWVASYIVYAHAVHMNNKHCSHTQIHASNSKSNII